MDLSQYAEMFLAESREPLGACNQLLLEWERHPAASEPVGGIFRAVHTVKGMAATMGYGRVADLAHRMENLLDHLRRGGKPPTDDTLQLLFRATDALEKSVGLAVAGREREVDIAALLGELDRAGAKEKSVPAAPAASAVASVAPIGSGRLITITLRPEAPLKGGRAMLIIRKAQKLGGVHRIQPPPAAFEADDFDGRFAFELDTAAGTAQIETALRAVGDVEAVTIGGGEEAHVTPAESAAAVAGRSQHIRVDLRRLDPLVHLLRNAVDHGIETPAERKRHQKNPEGEIVLAAVRERSSVAISISDDGRGIDRARILDKAKREGLVGPHVESLSDDQLLRVLARPGFSTATAVTNVSGRGVGIDVAMTRIRALGGSIEIRTEPGKGTAFVLRLPVTLAIVRALIAAVGTERYALPLTYVAETVEFGTTPLTTMDGRDAIVLRDRVVPLMDLRKLLGTNGGAPAPPPRRPVIVLEMGERRAGIVVDGMLSQQEIAVKGFDAPQGTLPVFSGATIMGDGVPALILDAAGLV